MSIAGPEDEYDEDLYSELEPREKSLLHYLVTIFADEDVEKSEYTHEGFRRALASTLSEETHAWLRTYQRLTDESVSLDPTLRYIADKHQVSLEDRQPDSLFGLAALVHDAGLSDEIDRIILGGRVRQAASNNTYVFDERLSLADLSDDIADFHSSWNRSEQSKAARVDLQMRTDESAALYVQAEKGNRPDRFSTFGFRTDANSEIPAQPQEEVVEVRRLKSTRVYIEQQDGETIVVLTDGKEGWKRVLNALFETLFEIEGLVNQLEERQIESASELEQEATESLESASDPIEQTRLLIDERADSAKEDVRSSSLSPSKRDNVVQALDSIGYNGSTVLDDPSVAAEEFSLVGREGLQEIFDRVNLMRDSFLDFLTTADDENAGLVLSIDGRNVAVRKGDYYPTDNAPLSDDAKVALRFFFDQETVL